MRFCTKLHALMHWSRLEMRLRPRSGKVPASVGLATGVSEQSPCCLKILVKLVIGSIGRMFPMGPRGPGVGAGELPGPPVLPP